jgi:hypothetical protein
MNRSKIVAIVTGAISILLAIAYLILVQLLDFRGEMLPAPQEVSGAWCVVKRAVGEVSSPMKPRRGACLTYIV